MESYSSSAGAPSYSLLMGQTAYLCISLNGKVTSLFNVVVDQYTAISLTGSAWMGRGERGIVCDYGRGARGFFLVAGDCGTLRRRSAPSAEARR